MGSNNKKTNTKVEELTEFEIVVTFFGGRTTKKKVWSSSKENAIIETRETFSEDELNFIDSIS